MQFAIKHSSKLWLIILILLCLVGVFVVRNNGLPQRMSSIDLITDNQALGLENRFMDQLLHCTWSREKQIDNSPQPDLSECLVGAGGEKSGSNLLFIGDSHAEHYFLGLTNWALNSNRSFHFYLAPGCPIYLEPALRVQRHADYRYCYSYTNRLNQILDENSGIDHIVWAIRSDLYTEPNLPNEVPSFLLADPKQKPVLSTSRDNYFTFTANFIQDVVRRGYRLTILGQVPLHTVFPDKCMRRSATPMYKVLPINFEKCKTTSRSYTIARQEDSRRQFISYSNKYSSVRFFDPLEHFCDDENCKAVSDGMLLYRDEDHLNANGSVFIGQFFEI